MYTVFQSNDWNQLVAEHSVNICKCSHSEMFIEQKDAFSQWVVHYPGFSIDYQDRVFFMTRILFYVRIILSEQATLPWSCLSLIYIHTYICIVCMKPRWTTKFFETATSMKWIRGLQFSEATSRYRSNWWPMYLHREVTTFTDCQVKLRGGSNAWRLAVHTTSIIRLMVQKSQGQPRGMTKTL